MARLGSKLFEAGAGIDSNVFRPTPGAIYHTMVARSTRAGTVALIFVDAFSDEELPQGSAVVGAAGEDVVFVITYPIAGAYKGAFLRYFNTDSTAGNCTFTAGSGGES